MRAWILIALPLVLAVSASSYDSPAATPTTSTASNVGCPFGVSGAVATVDDVTDGIAMTVLVPNDRVVELRARARQAAKMYGPGAHKGMGHNGQHERGGRKHGLFGMNLPPSRVSVTDVENGVRLTFTPGNKGDVPLLVTKVHNGAIGLNANACTP
jgi:hypothetical protein